jgi:hypothetical protein
LKNKYPTSIKSFVGLKLPKISESNYQNENKRPFNAPKLNQAFY